MKTIISYFALTIFLLVLIVVGGFAACRSPFFNLKGIHYEYSVTQDSAQYIETLKPAVESELQKYIGQSLWKIDIFKIEKQLLTKSWIKNVLISRDFPNEITIQIESKKFIANILSTPSQLQPVAEDATVMGAVDITKSPMVPVLSHPQFVVNKNLRQAALEFLKELPADGSFSSKNISEILPLRKNASNIESFKILMKNTKAEVLIDNQNVPIKAQRVSRVIDYLGDKAMEDRIIDANFSKKVLVRPRKAR